MLQSTPEVRMQELTLDTLITLKDNYRACVSCQDSKVRLKPKWSLVRRQDRAPAKHKSQKPGKITYQYKTSDVEI
jgi:hypothetical protein